jgi:CBS domain-containing protein
MQARDIMTKPVVWISHKAKIVEAIDLMLKSRLSGLPVIDEEGRLVGILSEGDLLRRTELGTEHHRPRWIEAFLMPGRSAQDYAHAHGRLVHEVMTRDPVCVDAATPLDEIVSLMEGRRIKRLPVLSHGALVGIVTRADLLGALADRLGRPAPARSGDLGIKEAIEAELRKQAWAPGPGVRVIVKDGVVELEGVILNDRLRDAIRVCAENVEGVKAVHDHLVFVEPYTGAYADPDEPAPRKVAPETPRVVE